MTDDQTTELKTTPLDALHRRLGAKMVPFAGYDMPVQYETGIIAEHNHTRDQASLFDVSHMGQAHLSGDDAVAALETLVPGDIQALTEGKIRYTALTNSAGGIMDDLMVTHGGDHLFLVVNAGNKDADFAHIRDHIGDRTELNILEGRALVALQGPKAAEVLSRLAPDAGSMSFMTAETLNIGGADCFVTRSGYSGEDGYEISIPGEAAEDVTTSLLDEDEVLPAGLGARDSLRLEAGLCLHGNDIDATTTPIEASLIWTISKRRRAEGGFPGAAVIQDQIANGAPRKLVGILPEGRAPARAHTEITDADGASVGEITSGGFGPSVGGPVAMGYVRTDLAKADTPLNLIVRGKALPAKVIKLPFVPHSYYSG